ncbi:MAG TPA: peptidyl-prolyl cis-trans isomerase [Bryobacteraceae bacterium]|nr:peptidyl-prolyl cis-trans isomerase [Bryobacteraceae bacterium]
MFDLFRSRDKAVRLLLGALLVLVALSMLTYLVPSYNTGGMSPDAVVAQVGSEAITELDVQRAVQNAMRSGRIPAEIMPTYVPQIVQQMITERALAYEAQRLGFHVSDQQLADFIQAQPQFASLFPGGKFVGKAAYAAMLAQMNTSMDDFEASVRREMLGGRLHSIALEGIVVSPAEIEQAYRDKNEQLQIEYVKLTADKYKKEAEPTLEEMQTYFKTNAARYTVPESKDLVILVADQSKLEQTLNPTDDQLHREYTQNLDSFRVPEQVKIRHILLMTQGKPAADDAKIKAKAEDLLKQVRAGANFDELAKKYSEDPGLKTNGDTYTVQHNGQMVKEFEDAAFRLKPGESDLIKTTYGYHVVQVIQHDPAHVKSFDEVKADLISQWRKQQVADVMQKIEDQVQQAFQKDPSHPDQVAAQFNMDVVKADNVQPGKPIPGIGSNPDLDQAIAGLKVGEVSEPVALAGNKLVVAELTGIVPPRPSTFDEVKDQIKDTMTTSRVQAKVQQHAQELMEKAKAMGGDLEKVAKAMGLDVRTSADFTRSGTINAEKPATGETPLGSAAYVQEGFTKPVGTLLGPITTPDSTVVVKVVAHIEPDMSKLPAARAQLLDEIKRQRAQDRATLFDAGVRNQLVKDGKIKVHQDVMMRLINSYKTS